MHNMIRLETVRCIKCRRLSNIAKTFFFFWGGGGGSYAVRPTRSSENTMYRTQ